MAISLFPLYEGETLENNIARYVEYMGLTSTQKLRRRLFGYQCRAGTRFPCGISHLAQQTRDYWNLNADQIIDRHTEFNYLTMMASPALRSDIRVAMQNLHVTGAWKLKFRFTFERDSRPRYCVECLADWDRKGRVPYCKISHQLPGSYYCDVHLSPLMAADGSPFGEVPAAMLKPLIHKSDLAVVRDVAAAEASAIKSVSINSARQQRVGATRGRTQYLRLLRDAGFVSPGGRLRMTALVNDWLAFFGQTYCHLTGLDEQKIFDWWRFVNGSSKTISLAHPFLFLAADSLLESRVLCPGTYLPLVPKYPVKVIPPILLKCNGALHRNCDSYGAIRRSNTTEHWKVLCSCGIGYKVLVGLRDVDVHMVPFAYGERYKQRFDVLLAIGRSTSFAACELGISINTAAAWKRAKGFPKPTKVTKQLPGAEVNELRHKWQEMIEVASRHGRRSTAYREGAAIYRKLAQHDHEWLQDFNRGNGAFPIRGVPRSNNQLTEARLQSVRQAYAELMVAEPPVYITRSAIVRRAGFASSVKNDRAWSELLSQLAEAHSTYLDRVLSWLSELPRSRRPRNRLEFARLTRIDWQSLTDEQKNRARACISSAGLVERN
ncbi:TnsD family Tn7-like transposition protein [Paraburkholderia nemoris]|uniref:TnsD family Tn7-like transposition protein n=1 Tax=Paraburkholderia nemoris TaxID=2793076 RepID=UPI0038B6E494